MTAHTARTPGKTKLILLGVGFFTGTAATVTAFLIF